MRASTESETRAGLASVDSTRDALSNFCNITLRRENGSSLVLCGVCREVLTVDERCPNCTVWDARLRLGEAYRRLPRGRR